MLLHVSAFLKQSDEFKHEQGGCPISNVIFRQALPISHGSNVGSLLVHSHVCGFVVLLQRSEVSEQCASSKQEHAGCFGFSVTFTQILPAMQGADIGPLKLHSQFEGMAVMLQVSALSKQSDFFKQEHGGCSVTFKHTRPGSHGSEFGPLVEHWHIDGFKAVLHVSELSEQWSGDRQEQAGCAGFSVRFTHSLPGSHGA